MWPFPEDSGHAETLRSRALAAIAAFLLLCGSAGASAEGPPAEWQVKAAHIYNFAKFVQWPEDAFATPRAPLVLCIASGGARGGAFDAIDGKPVQGRDLRVRTGVRPADLKACHILFVPESAGPAVPDLFRVTGTSPTLIVGEAEGFAAAGGSIGFVAHDERVEFEINPDAASRANLKISSQLLRMATIVRDARRSGP